MGDYKGFLKYNRKDAHKLDPQTRINHYNEIYLKPSPEHLDEQSARCMSCGIPFCHNGCPLGNKIPDFNDAVHNQEWHKAYDILSSTNNFPEFTGRICPAPCEASCVLGLNSEAVTIEYIEKNIIETAYTNNWVQPTIESNALHGKKVAIVGGGPAGLACADELAKVGCAVTVYEKSDKVGGLLRYGIPDFKLEKWVIDRRIAIMAANGINFICNTEVGKDISAPYLESEYDAIVLTIGAGVPRDVPITGRDAKGIYFAMDFLTKSNIYVSQGQLERPTIDVAQKHVVVIGGGDTGADCVGTSHRQGAAAVTQLELLYKPNLQRTQDDPWPKWPMILRTSTSHEEGGNREWSVLTKAFLKNNAGELIGLQVVEVEWSKNEITNQYAFVEIPYTERTIPCDVAFLAVGFVHGDHAVSDAFGLVCDTRGNIDTTQYTTSKPNIFAAGDARRGQSLVVWAIAEGREAAHKVVASLSEVSLSSGYKMV